MLPAPWLQDSILNANTQDQFELICIVLTATKTQLVVAKQSYMLTTSVLGPGEQELVELRSQSLKLTQANPELETYHSSHHHECITGFSDNTSNQHARNNRANVNVLLQLIWALPIKQKKQRRPTSCARTKLRERENMMMRRKIGQRACLKSQQQQEHWKFIWNLWKAAKIPQHRHKRNSWIRAEPPTQFAPGIVQHLYHDKFISANSSTPSNFTAFGFYTQPPLLRVKQDNYLICHLIHEISIKQLPDKIKSSDLICSRNSPAPLPWQIHQCKLEYAKQLHSSLVSTSSPLFLSV